MKYIIEFPEEPLSILALSVVRGIPKATKAEFEPYTEPDRKAIEDEVWEFTGKIQKMTCEQMHEVLGITAPNYDYFCNEISYQEARSKYEEWKAEKDEIRVGDEVEYYCGKNIRFVVCGIYKGIAYGFKYCTGFGCLDMGDYCKIDELKKTGRHYDGVEKLLKEMREETE